MRSAVQVCPGPPGPIFRGAVAQLVERWLCKPDVVGSTPSGSTPYIQCQPSTLTKTSKVDPSYVRRRYFSHVSAYPADNVKFTPYMEPLEKEARVKVRELFNFKEEAILSWHLRHDERLHVVVGEGDEPLLEFDIEKLKADTRAWFKGSRLALSYRKGRGGQDPMEDPRRRTLLEKVRQRIETLDEFGWDGGPIDETLNALRSLKQFEEVEEYYFRQARPRELIIRLGFRCNQDCWFCWQGRKWPEPPAELYHRWLE